MVMTTEVAEATRKGTRRWRLRPDETEELWRAYKDKPTAEGRNRLIEVYLPLVKRTAERLYQKLPHNIELDDLVSAGIFGLRDAIVQTVHNYTIFGLITEADRTDAGHRLYAESVFDRLERVRNLKEQGMTLSEIRELLAQEE